MLGHPISVAGGIKLSYYSMFQLSRCGLGDTDLQNTWSNHFWQGLTMDGIL